MVGKSFMQGHAPKVVSKPTEEKVTKISDFIESKMTGNRVAEMLGISDEQQKYTKAWNVKDYRNVSPGENCVDMFLDVVADLSPDSERQTLCDLGAGTGRAAISEPTVALAMLKCH